MKKILSVLVAALLSSSAIFAFSFELGLNYQAGLSHSVTPKELKYGGKTMDIPEAMQDRILHTMPSGFAFDMNFYVAHPAFVDIGIAFGGGVGFFGDVKIDDVSLKEALNMIPGSNIKILGIEPFGKIGLATRFNIHKNHAIYFSPSFIIGGDVMGLIAEKNGDKKFDTYGHLIFYGLDLDVAYQLWLVSKSAYSFGLNVGVNFNTPLGMRVWLQDLDSTLKTLTGSTEKVWCVGTGTAFKLHAGVVFNFGKRAVPVIK